MDLNKLYLLAKNEDSSAEVDFFETLSARFRLFVRRRIRNQEDGEEIVQNALMAINSEYRTIDIEVSFSAWAYKVLNNRIKAYLKTKARSARRTVSMTDSDWADLTPCRETDLELKRTLLSCLGKIGQVNIRYARVLNLKVQGYQTDEICSRLAITSTNLYSILCRARIMLEQCLEKGDIS